MTISKRLRYEILRRDNYACRYCGTQAAIAPLTIDHVIPRVLGGKDEPQNLVAACADCNAGKSTSTIDHPPVADVPEENFRLAKNVAAALERRRERRRVLSHEAEVIGFYWETADFTPQQLELCSSAPWEIDWDSDPAPPTPGGEALDETLVVWLKSGVDVEHIYYLMRPIRKSTTIPDDQKWARFADAVERSIRSLRREAIEFEARQAATVAGSQ